MSMRAVATNDAAQKPKLIRTIYTMKDFPVSSSHPIWKGPGCMSDFPPIESSSAHSWVIFILPEHLQWILNLMHRITSDMNPGNVISVALRSYDVPIGFLDSKYSVNSEKKVMCDEKFFENKGSVCAEAFVIQYSTNGAPVQVSRVREDLKIWSGSTENMSRVPEDVLDEWLSNMCKFTVEIQRMLGVPKLERTGNDSQALPKLQPEQLKQYEIERITWDTWATGRYQIHHNFEFKYDGDKVLCETFQKFLGMGNDFVWLMLAIRDNHRAELFQKLQRQFERRSDESPQTVWW